MRLLAAYDRVGVENFGHLQIYLLLLHACTVCTFDSSTTHGTTCRSTGDSQPVRSTMRFEATRGAAHPCYRKDAWPTTAHRLRQTRSARLDKVLSQNLQGSRGSLTVLLCSPHPDSRTCSESHFHLLIRPSSHLTFAPITSSGVASAISKFPDLVEASASRFGSRGASVRPTCHTYTSFART